MPYGLKTSHQQQYADRVTILGISQMAAWIFLLKHRDDYFIWNRIWQYVFHYINTSGTPWTSSLLASYQTQSCQGEMFLYASDANLPSFQHLMDQHISFVLIAVRRFNTQTYSQTSRLHLNSSLMYFSKSILLKSSYSSISTLTKTAVLSGQSEIVKMPYCLRNA